MNQTPLTPVIRRRFVAAAITLVLAVVGLSTPLTASAEEPALGTISGVVTDSVSGAPIPGVSVGFGALTDFFAATTDSTGAYSIENLPIGDYYPNVYGVAGYQETYFDTLTISDSLLDVTFDIQLVPYPSGTTSLSGVISDSTPSTPLDGAEVTIYSPDAPYSATTFSDPAGAYAFTALPAGSYFVSVYLEGFLFDYQEVALAADEVHDHSRALVPANSQISGRVVDRDGVAVSGLYVHAQSNGGTSAGDSYTDEFGYYALTGIGAGSYTITLGGPGTPWNEKSKSKTVQANSTKTVNFTVKPRTTASVFGYVLAEEGGGIEGICVAAIKVGSGNVVAETRTTAEADYQLDALKPGNYKIRFTDCDSDRSPKYAKAFWEDASKRVDATIITVAAGEDLNLEQMTMSLKTPRQRD